MRTPRPSIARGQEAPTDNPLLARSRPGEAPRPPRHRQAEVPERPLQRPPLQPLRSDAEAKALETLHDAGEPPPVVNERIAGEEADLTYPERRLIIEIDGPQFHQISAEDERKQGIWETAGYVVRRISSDDVYKRPELLIGLIRAPTTRVSPAA